MEQFTFSFEDLIRFFRRQQRRDYEGIDVILSIYDTTTLSGIRRQYSITAILMELGLNPTENQDDSESIPEEPIEETRTFKVEGSYEIIVCQLLNYYKAYSVFLN
jgi:hypothetical protein